MKQDPALEQAIIQLEVDYGKNAVLDVVRGRNRAVLIVTPEVRPIGDQPYSVGIWTAETGGTLVNTETVTIANVEAATRPFTIRRLDDIGPV